MKSLSDLLGEGSSYDNMSLKEREYFIQILQEEIKRREEESSRGPEQIRDIIPIESWINSTYYVGNDCMSIYPYWKDFIVDIFRESRSADEKINQVILGGCFTGDTKVSLLDGRELSFEELVAEYGTDNVFWVYSIDDSGNIVPGLAHNARKTKVNSKLVEVTLDNGEKIRCTPDHKFMLGNGFYKRAEELRPRHYLKTRGTAIEVVDVRYLRETEDVYDIEVEQYHNFALSSGVFVHNSIGIGKTTCAEIILMRKLYELSCFKNINSMFDLMSKTNIMFLYFSVNKTQAARGGFGDLRNLFDSCPYFVDNFKRNQKVNEVLVFPEGLTFAYGSGSSDSIGLSVMCSLMDEANFSGGYRTTGNAERASDMYAGIVNRANSRFIIRGGENYSLNILVSSSTTENSVTERMINASKNDPHTIYTSPSQWEVKPDKFSKKFFYVLKGTDYLEPQIIRSTDDVNNFRISEGLNKERFVDGLETFEDIDKEIKKLPEHMQAKFLRVPEDLRQGFETSIMRSLQDMGGVSIASTGKLFSSVAVYNACVTSGFYHPFFSDSLIISTGDVIEIKDYLKSDFRFKYPERPRYIHIDQSYRTDDTGISCVYMDDLIIGDDGVKKPIFGVDFMLQINPPKPPKKIAIYKIRNFVTYLAFTLGLKIGMVSYDIFNSEESRQILEEMGLNVRYQSVDRTDKAYLDLVEIMYEGRLRMYEYQPFRHEIFNVVHYRDRRRVDHVQTNADGSTGKKDVADSLAGAVQNALMAKIDDGTQQGSTVDSFLHANERSMLFEPSAMTVEEMVDRQIEDMIDAMEYQAGFDDGIHLF